MIQYCFVVFVVFVVVVAVVFFGGGREGGENRFTQQGHER